MPPPSSPSTGQPTGSEPGALTLAVRSDRIVLVGIGLWALALVLTLVVPSWHTGDREWWPWACVTGLVLGAVGWAYLRRGRGNAAEANRPVAVPPVAAERVEQVRQRRGKD